VTLKETLKACFSGLFFLHFLLGASRDDFTLLMILYDGLCPHLPCLAQAPATDFPCSCLPLPFRDLRDPGATAATWDHLDSCWLRPGFRAAVAAGSTFQPNFSSLAQ